MIAQELRRGSDKFSLVDWVWAPLNTIGGMTMAAFECVSDARVQLGIDQPLCEVDHLLPDILSEAIEAAEALGL